MGTDPVPFDVASDPDATALSALADELAAAGARVRNVRLSTGADRPTVTFAAELRSRLVTAYGAGGPVPAGAGAASGGTTATGLLPTQPVSPTLPDAAGLATAVVGRLAGLVSARSWALLAAAAAIILAVVGVTDGDLLQAPLEARAGAAVGATLVRGGTTLPLAAGAALRPYDEVRVDSSGQATLDLAGGEARLAGGAVVRIIDLGADRIRLALLAGRTYHRVVVPSGATYVVTTGTVSWTALGTAFELDRDMSGAGTERVTFIGLQHSVSVVGPDLRASVGEGRTAAIDLDSGGPSDLAVGPIDPTTLDDPWLVANADRDRDLGFPVGVMTGLAPSRDAPPTPTQPGPEIPGREVPTATESPAASPSAAGSGEPSTRPIQRSDATAPPAPTPKPTPRPPAVLGLRLLPCGGGVVIDWTAYHGRHFARYVTLRGTGSAIPAAYPPHGGVTTVDGASTTERWRTSAHDSEVVAGAYAFRTLALDRTNKVIGASPVRAATGRPVGDLGQLVVGPGDGGTTTFSWTPYEGSAACFDVAKLVYSESDPTPSYLDGAAVLFATNDQGVGEAIRELGPGTYHFRVQVIRFTELGMPAKFVVAQSDVATYTVP